MAFKLYGKLAINLVGGETAGETAKIDWLSDTLKVALFTSSYTPDQHADETYSGISATELANGNGYTTGGNTIGSATVGYTSGTKTSKFDAADPTTWTASGALAFRYPVVYDFTTGLLIGYDDYGSTLTLASGDTYSYIFDAAGIWTATVA